MSFYNKILFFPSLQKIVKVKTVENTTIHKRLKNPILQKHKIIRKVTLHCRSPRCSAKEPLVVEGKMSNVIQYSFSLSGVALSNKDTSLAFDVVQLSSLITYHLYTINFHCYSRVTHTSSTEIYYPHKTHTSTPITIRT